jgi:hypothetical protein
MRYGKSRYWLNAREEQAEAFRDEIADYLAAERSRRAKLDAIYARALNLSATSQL